MFRVLKVRVQASAAYMHHERIRAATQIYDVLHDSSPTFKPYLASHLALRLFVFDESTRYHRGSASTTSYMHRPLGPSNYGFQPCCLLITALEIFGRRSRFYTAGCGEPQIISKAVERARWTRYSHIAVRRDSQRGGCLLV